MKKAAAGEASNQARRDVAIRIGEVAEKVGGKRTLAKLTGISEPHLYRLIAGNSSPTVEPLKAIARAGNVSIDWLVGGGYPAHDVPGSSNLLAIPLVEAKTVNGERAFAREAFMYVSSAWLDQRFKGMTLSFVKVQDDGMAPMFNPDDLLLVDETQKVVSGDGVYVAIFADKFRAKHFQWLSDRKLEMKSEKSSLKPIVWAQKEVERGDVEIFGRVVWHGHQI